MDRLTKYLLITLGIVIAVGLLRKYTGIPFFLIFSPIPQEVQVYLNVKNLTYEADVTLSTYNYATGNTYTYYFVLKNFDSKLLNETACYLYVPRVDFKGQYGVYWAWSIYNMTLKAPLINNICDFWNNGILINPGTAVYKYIEYSPSTGRTTETTYSCSQLGKTFCLDKAKVDGSRISGKLVLYMKQLERINCNSFDGFYCSDENTVEIRDYYCPSGYGQDDMCINQCKYKIIFTKNCPQDHVCKEGECIFSFEKWFNRNQRVIVTIIGFIIVLIIAIILIIKKR
jgi:hypothetical protein